MLAGAETSSCGAPVLSWSRPNDALKLSVRVVPRTSKASMIKHVPAWLLRTKSAQHAHHSRRSVGSPRPGRGRIQARTPKVSKKSLDPRAPHKLGNHRLRTSPALKPQQSKGKWTFKKGQNFLKFSCALFQGVALFCDYLKSLRKSREMSRDLERRPCIWTSAIHLN